MFGPEMELVEKELLYSSFEEALTAYVRDVGAPVPRTSSHEDTEVIGDTFDGNRARGKLTAYSALRTRVHEQLFGEE